MCDVTAAVVGVGMAAGAVAGSQKKKGGTTTQTSTTSPWAPQANQLEYAFDEARNLYDNAPATYTGDLSAGMTDATRTGINQAIDYSNTTGANLAQGVTDQYGTLAGATGGFIDRATNLATTGTGPMNATSEGVLAAGALGPLEGPNSTFQAGTTGMRDTYGTATDLVARATGANPSEGALGMGGQFANSDVVQAQIDNAALDVRRNFNENTAPTLNARASAGGNLNSARAGIAEALAARDAGEGIGRIASTMRSNAFNRGVDAYMTGNQQNNALALGANQQAGTLATNAATLGENIRQFDTGSRIQSATTLGTQDLANRTLDANTRLSANAQVGEGVLASPDFATTGMTLADANFTRQVQAGTLLQAEDQRALDEAYEQYMRDYNTQQGYLSNYMGTIGSTNWGQNSTGTVTTPTTGGGVGGALTGAIGGATAGFGMMGYLPKSYQAGGANSSLF